MKTYQLFIHACVGGVEGAGRECKCEISQVWGWGSLGFELRCVFLDQTSYYIRSAVPFWILSLVLSLNLSDVVMMHLFRTFPLFWVFSSSGISDVRFFSYLQWSTVAMPWIQNVCEVVRALTETNTLPETSYLDKPKAVYDNSHSCTVHLDTNQSLLFTNRCTIELL
jgi:hypothetical protein